MGNTLIGLGEYGGANGNGTLFSLDTNGGNFFVHHVFSTSSLGKNYDGANPTSPLAVANATLFGAAYDGGTNAYGVVFSYSLSPILGIARSGTNVVVTWTNAAPGFTLKTTPNLLTPMTNWSTVTPAPVIINNQFTVTNATAGTNIFYRLSL